MSNEFKIEPRNPLAQPVNPPRGGPVGQRPATGPSENPFRPHAALDAINPRHYRELKPEPIDVIEGWGLGFCLGNALKYLARAGRKTEDPIEDLRKMIWYAEREITRRGGDNG